MVVKSDKGIKIGDVVKDLATGIQGTVVGLSQYVTGIWQIIVQPPAGEDGKAPETIQMDEPGIDLVTSSEATYPCQEPKFPLGAKVASRLTGQQCLIHSIYYWIHGCARYTVYVLGETTKNGSPIIQHMDEVYLELVEKSEHKVEPLASGQPRGGPEKTAPRT